MNITTKTNDLWKRAKNAFLKKDLEQALAKADDLLQFAQKHHLPTEIINIKIFIGKTLTTKGRYIGGDAYFSKAHDVLEDIQDQQMDRKGVLELLLLRSEIHLLQEELNLASAFADQALSHSQKENYDVGVILSQITQTEILIFRNQFSEALAKAHLCLKKLNDIEEPLIKAEVYNLLCKIFIQQQDYKQILKYGEEALKISKAEGDVEKEIIAESNLAVYYGAQLDYKTSIQYLFLSVDKSEKIRFDLKTAQNNINIATIYAHLYNSKEALGKYLSVLENYTPVLVDTVKTILYNNIGKIYYHQRDFKNSKRYFEQSLSLAIDIQYQEMIALALAHLGQIGCEEQEFEKALGYADRSNELLEDLGDVNAKSINLLNFAKLAYRSGDFETATKHLLAGVEISKKVNNEENEIACYNLLAKYYQSKRDFENAFHYQRLFAEKQEAYLKKQRDRQILDQEIKFATREQKQQIDRLKKENQFQAMLLEKQTEVEQANEQLTQANEELKQFAYVASHDLKEPLRMIGSYTKLIQKKYADQTDESTTIFFHYVTDGVERMNGLLDGLLKYSTVGRGGQDLQPVNLNDILLICQSNLRLLIEETQTQIIADNLPTIRGIASLVSQLFQNLISNAIKFRKKEKTPKIKIAYEEREHDHLISIQDNGIGIKPEYKDQIFVIFQRLHARTEYEGTGIGLAICYKIMQRMGGKIWVASELGAGATFYFNFPKG
ncbi:MAG: ATP-binding protein [Bacteroidota bacterium]